MTANNSKSNQPEARHPIPPPPTQTQANDFILDTHWDGWEMQVSAEKKLPGGNKQMMPEKINLQVD